MLLKITIDNVKNKLIVERLTALWALNECGLGGIMHAFGSPFTGIVVGGFSILLITLIALHTNYVWSTLLKALSIVLLVKLSVSPHSPVTAYFAVSFQAFMGMVMYSLFSVNRLTIIFLGAVTFLESALQKLLTLTIIYGHSLWEAIDNYTVWVAEKLNFLPFALSIETIITFYITIYTITGILSAVVIIRIIKQMQTIEVFELSKAHIVKDSKKNFNNHKGKLRIFQFWAIALIIIVMPLLFLSSNYGGWETAIYLVSRSLLILILWYVVLSPLILKGLNGLLSKQKSEYHIEVKNTLELIPYLKSILRYAWQDSRSLKGINRMQNFLAKSIVYSIHFNPSKR